MAQPEGLDATQAAAVYASTHEPLFIVACAGSGKTRTLQHRIVHILRTRPDVGGRGLVCISFTVTAARELRRRVHAAVGGEYGVDHIWFGTFHGLARMVCHRWLTDAVPAARTNAFRVASGVGPVRLMATAYAAVGAKLPACARAASRLPPPSTASSAAATAAATTPNSLLPPPLCVPRKHLRQLVRTWDEKRASGTRHTHHPLQTVFTAYTAAMHAEGVLDFTELLHCATLILHKVPEARAWMARRAAIVCVDENQDSSFLASAFLAAVLDAAPDGRRRSDSVPRPLPRAGSAAAHAPQLTAVGDDWQAIYGFAGAVPRIFDKLRAKYWPRASTIVLPCNYRSTPEITALGTRIMDGTFVVDAVAAMAHSVHTMHAEKSGSGATTAAPSPPPVHKVCCATRPASRRRPILIGARTADEERATLVALLHAWCRGAPTEQQPAQRASLHTRLPAPLDSVWVAPSPPPTALPAAAAGGAAPPPAPRIQAAVRALHAAHGAPALPWHSAAIIARTNRALNSVVAALSAAGIPYYRCGGTRFERAHLADFLALLRVVGTTAAARAGDAAVGSHTTHSSSSSSSSSKNVGHAGSGAQDDDFAIAHRVWCEPHIRTAAQASTTCAGPCRHGNLHACPAGDGLCGALTHFGALTEFVEWSASRLESLHAWTAPRPPADVVADLPARNDDDAAEAAWHAGVVTDVIDEADALGGENDDDDDDSACDVYDGHERGRVVDALALVAEAFDEDAAASALLPLTAAPPLTGRKRARSSEDTTQVAATAPPTPAVAARIATLTSAFHAHLGTMLAEADDEAEASASQTGDTIDAAAGGAATQTNKAEEEEDDDDNNDDAADQAANAVFDPTCTDAAVAADDGTSHGMCILPTAAADAHPNTTGSPEDPRTNRVWVGTVHQAKGLEWPLVLFAHVNDGILPLHTPPCALGENEACGSCSACLTLEEEKRIFYVGTSRAVDTLIFTHAFTSAHGTELPLTRFLRRPYIDAGMIQRCHVAPV